MKTLENIIFIFIVSFYLHSFYQHLIKMPKEFTIDDFPALQSKHVYIKDKAYVMKTINEILHCGVNSLQIAIDFDFTITKQHVEGKKGLSSFGVFEKCKQLPKAFIEESDKLYRKYHAMEIDPTLCLEKKIKAMEDWMNLWARLINDVEFDPRELNHLVKSYGTDFRDGVPKLFKKLYSSRVPVMVFSAGLGDIVETHLKQHDLLFDNVKIISNYLEYNGNKIKGFKNDKLIHVFNKNEHDLEVDHLKILENRHNVVVMGDSLGDVNMTKGLKDAQAILKIGFLYQNVPENLKSYMDTFDIVLVDDQTMKIIEEILQNIL